MTRRRVLENVRTAFRASSASFDQSLREKLYLVNEFKFAMFGCFCSKFENVLVTTTLRGHSINNVAKRYLFVKKLLFMIINVGWLLSFIMIIYLSNNCSVRLIYYLIPYSFEIHVDLGRM